MSSYNVNHYSTFYFDRKTELQLRLLTVVLFIITYQVVVCKVIILPHSKGSIKLLFLLLNYIFKLKGTIR